MSLVMRCVAVSNLRDCFSPGTDVNVQGVLSAFFLNRRLYLNCSALVMCVTGPTYKLPDMC